MTRPELISKFRQENPEFTERALPDLTLYSWLEEGNREVCAKTHCIVDQDGSTIETEEDDQSWDLTAEIDNFFIIDTYSGGGITYNDKRIEEKTIAQLDDEAPNWRSRSSGTPKAWYQRGKWLYLDKPIDSNAYDLKVYCVLIPDIYNTDAAPFNALAYLEPYHYALIYYLQKRAKMKIGKEGEEIKALKEYDRYVQRMKTELGGSRYTQINYVKSNSY